jgi:hypothetical protein
MMAHPRFSFPLLPSLTAPRDRPPLALTATVGRAAPGGQPSSTGPAIQGIGIDFRRSAMAGASRSSADLDAATPCRGRMVSWSYAPLESVRENDQLRASAGLLMSIGPCPFTAAARKTHLIKHQHAIKINPDGRPRPRYGLPPRSHTGTLRVLTSCLGARCVLLTNRSSERTQTMDAQTIGGAVMGFRYHWNSK